MKKRRSGIGKAAGFVILVLAVVFIIQHNWIRQWYLQKTRSFGIQLESEDNETVGGLIIELLGEIPEDGSSAEGSEEIEVEYENYKFTVESVRDRRIERVRMEILPIKEKDEDDSKSE